MMDQNAQAQILIAMAGAGSEPSTAAEPFAVVARAHFAVTKATNCPAPACDTV